MAKLILVIFSLLFNIGQAAPVYVFDRTFAAGFDSPDRDIYKDHGQVLADIVLGLAPRAVIDKASVKSPSDMAAALYLISEKAVVNVSMSQRSYSPAGCKPLLQEAINDAAARGIIVVVSAGNNSDDAKFYSPGNCKNVVTVGASSFWNIPESYSNYGDCVAVFTRPATYKGDRLAGASFSAPVIAALISEWLSEDPDLTLEQVIKRLHEISNSQRVF